MKNDGRFPPCEARRVGNLILSTRLCISGARKRGFACDNGYTNVVVEKA